MSVLYKALQKAEKENEQRQEIASGKGFDPERLAGSGAIKLARGGGLHWRLVGLSAVGLLAVFILAIYFVTVTQPAPSSQVAKLPSPVPQSRLQSASQPPAQQPEAATIETTKPGALQSGAPAAAETPAPKIETAQTASSAVPPVTPANKATETISEPAPKSESAPSQVTQAPSSPPAAPASEPVAATKESKVQVAKAEPPASTRPAPAKAEANAKPVEIPRDSPAQMLSPPISITRSDFALSGVGRAVQVRQIAQDAQDNVGAGYAALLHGDYDTALGFYDRALAKEPTSVLGLLGRGAALQKLRRLEEAQEAYSKALKVDPQNREALTNITSIIADRAPAEALNRLLDLEKEYPAFSPIKAQIGLLYAKNGSMDQALDYLRRAIALTPESVMYQYNLALVLDHMNLREQAIDAYQRVLSAISLGEAPAELSLAAIDRRVRFLRAH